MACSEVRSTVERTLAVYQMEQRLWSQREHVSPGRVRDSSKVAKGGVAMVARWQRPGGNESKREMVGTEAKVV